MIKGVTYKIHNTFSGSVLDLSSRNNRYVVGYTAQNVLNQEWVLDTWTADGQVQKGTLKNVATDSYLAVDKKHDAALVIAADESFTWYFRKSTKDGDDVYQLYVKEGNTEYNLDLAGHADGTRGTDTQIWAASNHTWKFEMIVQSGSVYKLVNENGEYLADSSNKAAVASTTDGGDDYQHWLFLTSGAEYMFKNIKTNRYLAVQSNTSLVDGAKVECIENRFLWDSQTYPPRDHAILIPDKKLAVSASSDGTVKLTSNTSTKDALWKFDYVRTTNSASRGIQDGGYRLISIDTGRILGVTDTDDAVATNTDKNTATTLLKWTLNASSDGWTLKNQKDSKYLCYNLSNKTVDMTSDLSSTCKWQLEANGLDNNPPVNFLYVPNKNLVVTVLDNDGKNLKLAAPGGKSSWRFEQA